MTGVMVDPCDPTALRAASRLARPDEARDLGQRALSRAHLFTVVSPDDCSARSGWSRGGVPCPIGGTVSCSRGFAPCTSAEAPAFLGERAAFVRTGAGGIVSSQSPYSRDFFANHEAGAVSSAREMLPPLLGAIRPRSVIDIGCGTAAWLAVARELGVAEVLGVDGDYVDRQALMIPKDAFRPHDLSRPLRIGRRFDMAICLEVAEHLPPSSACDLVVSLTTLAPFILFSAAIPFQDGTNHVNCQWPDYWAELFRAAGFLATDPLRSRVWHNPRVEFWYAQNSFVYVSQDVLTARPDVEDELGGVVDDPLRLVHPALYLRSTDARSFGIRRSAALTRAALRRRLSRAWRGNDRR